MFFGDVTFGFFTLCKIMFRLRFFDKLLILSFLFNLITGNYSYLLLSKQVVILITNFFQLLESRKFSSTTVAPSTQIRDVLEKKYSKKYQMA